MTVPATFQDTMELLERCRLALEESDSLDPSWRVLWPYAFGWASATGAFSVDTMVEGVVTLCKSGESLRLAYQWHADSRAREQARRDARAAAEPVKRTASPATKPEGPPEGRWDLEEDAGDQG